MQLNLEEIQLESARIATGITRSAFINKSYKGIGSLTIENRRKYLKKTLIIIYKIVNGLTPEYLHENFPQNISVHVITSYPLCNIHQIDSIACRIEVFSKSFIPPAVSLWNELPVEPKSLQSVSSFKW